MIHGHGDDLYKSQVQIKANFSTNVWYEADTRPLCDFLSTHLEGIFHYPEPDAGSFRKVAAACHGLTPFSPGQYMLPALSEYSQLLSSYRYLYKYSKPNPRQK